MRDKLVRLLIGALFTIAAVLPIAGRTYAGLGGCAHCGRGVACEKTCRLVREDKKVDIVCWGVKCEPFCLPCHSKRDCKHHEQVCDDCDEEDEDISTRPKKFVWYEWIPGCAKIETKKKLMKKTITKKIPSYKWVVEDLCAECKENAPVAEIEHGATIPPKPVLTGK